MCGLTLLILSLCLIKFSLSLNGRGLTPLDSTSFSKITSKFSATLIKFDKYFPYGPDHDEFVKVAISAVNDTNFLVAEVGVKDYGDFENQDLLERFNLTQEELPVIKLFFPDGRPAATFAERPVVAAAVRRFCRRAAGWPLPGTLPPLDVLAGRFMTAVAAGGDGAEWTAAEAARLRDACAEPERRRRVDYYVSVMRLVMSRGASAVQQERRRLAGLLRVPLSEHNRADVQYRLNVLESFQPIDDVEGRDEL